MNKPDTQDKPEARQSEDAARDDKIESMKPKDDGSCGCGQGDAKEQKEGERES